MTVPKPALVHSKGTNAEELLRRYFLTLGYFAVRGVKLTYQEFDVTDVDLWLYSRHSPASRERVNVDIKNKRTPQAIERVLWAAGLRNILRLDRCIVVTTDKRSAVVDFGREHGITVLDGVFLSALSGKELPNNRLFEEELISRFKFGDGAGLVINCAEIFDIAKSCLLDRLNYDGVNIWLEMLRDVLGGAAAHSRSAEPMVRLAYLLMAFVLLGIDFANADHAFEPREKRQQVIVDGIRYGNEGRARLEAVKQLLEDVKLLRRGRDNDVLRSIGSELELAAKAVPADILAEYLTKPSISNHLVLMALKLEAAGYARTLVWPGDLEADVKGIVAVIVDFLGLGRERVLGLKAAQQNVDSAAARPRV